MINVGDTVEYTGIDCDGEIYITSGVVERIRSNYGGGQICFINGYWIRLENILLPETPK